MINREQITDDIVSWNIRFPYDRTWRAKYKVPFGSKDHKGISFLDQIFDIEEDLFFEELINRPDYIPNTGDWIKLPKATEQSFQNSIESFREEFKDIIEDAKDE